MNNSQRAAAERLADSLEWLLRNCADPDSYPMSMYKEAAALLRELAAKPVQEPAQEGWKMVARERGWLEPQATKASEFQAVKDARAAAEYELRFYRQMMADKNAEPVQEPVIWIQSNHLQHAQNGPHFARTGPTKLQSDYVPLYAHPPQQRVPLTKVQLWSLPEMRGWFPQDHYRLEALARAIEHMHGITGEPT